MPHTEKDDYLDCLHVPDKSTHTEDSTHGEGKAVPFSTHRETESEATGKVIRIIDATQKHYPFPRTIMIKLLRDKLYWYAEVEGTLVFARCFDKDDLRNFIVQNLNYADLFTCTTVEKDIMWSATANSKEEETLWLVSVNLPLEL